MLGGNANVGGSSEEKFFSQMSPVDQLKLKRELANKREYSPSEAQANLQKTLEGLAYSTPVVANAMSIRDAYEAKERAGKTADPAEKKQAEAESVASALSAFLPFGIGKPAAGSASRFGVFVPVKEGKTADRARNMFDRVADEVDPQEANRRVWRETETFFGPEGTHLREIRDNPGMEIKGEFKPGKSYRMDEVIDHPGLFAEEPQLKDLKVRFLDSPKDPRADRYTGSDPRTGEILIDESFQGNDLRVQLAKMLQYRLNEKYGRVNAAREGPNTKIADANAAIENTRRAMAEGVVPEDQGSVFIKSLQDTLDEGQNVRSTQTVAPGSYAESKGYKPGEELKYKQRKALHSRFWTDRSAGKQEIKEVKSRAFLPERSSEFPYKRTADKISEGAVIPPTSLTGAALAKFIENWQRYGAGRRSKAR